MGFLPTHCGHPWARREGDSGGRARGCKARGGGL